jgi:phage tail-like protein
VPDGPVRVDPALTFRFAVTFDGLPPVGFSDCNGIQMDTEVHEQVEGGLNTHTWRFVTRSKQSNLTLKRGIVNRVLWDWYHDITIGKMQFRNATIAVLDAAGTDHVIEFQLLQAFPIKWVGPELSAAQSTIAVETIEIAHQGLERRK